MVNSTAVPSVDQQGDVVTLTPKGYHRRKTLAVEAVEDEYGAFQVGDPRVEAQWLLRLVGKNGETVD